MQRAHRTASNHAAGHPLKFTKKRYAPRDISDFKGRAHRMGARDEDTILATFATAGRTSARLFRFANP